MSAAEPIDPNIKICIALADISYFNSPLSRDGEQLGLGCSGATQLFEVNVFKMKSVLDQVIIAETKT